MALTIVDKVNKVPSPSLLYKDIPFGSLFRWANSKYCSVGYKTFDGGYIFLTDTNPTYHNTNIYDGDREVVLLEYEEACGELVITKEL